MDERPRFADESQPANFKTACDGGGGLVRVRLVGPPHDGRALYIDELDLPAVIYTTTTPEYFEWWPERTQRAREEAGGAATRQAGRRHILRIAEDSRIPTFESEAAPGN